MAKSRFGWAVVGSLAMATALAGCGADRSGTITGGPSPAITIEVDGCVPTSSATKVTWAGRSTASVRVTYLQNGKSLASAWTNVAVSANGTATVAVPAGVDATWRVGTVSLSSKRNGSGTVTDRAVECAAASSNTAPTTTEGMVSVANQ